MRDPRLCALVTKTSRGRRQLPLDGRKKYYDIILLLYYDYYKIINLERTPPPTTVHPTPPRHTMLSDNMCTAIYTRIYYVHRSIDRTIQFSGFYISLWHSIVGRRVYILLCVLSSNRLSVSHL